ncbi:MAG: hypothetical protein ACKOC8_11385 [Pirellulales bacterium]
MSGKIFGRLIGAVACVAAFVSSWDAEAARCHRRRCCEPCCYVEPVCCETACSTSCCGSSCGTVAHYDSCGRLHCHRVACCETIVSSTVVTSCCGVAATSSPTPAVAKATSAPSQPQVAAVSVAK